jgi:hypothetical protein
MLAVASHMQRQRQQQGSSSSGGSGTPERLHFRHCAAEDTKLPPESFDLVSSMLVSRAFAALVCRPSAACAVRCPLAALLPCCNIDKLHVPIHPPPLLLQVCHELPAAASQAIFQEAFRLLRPGGALAVMVRTLLAEAGAGAGTGSHDVPAFQPALPRPRTHTRACRRCSPPAHLRPPLPICPLAACRR